MSGAKDVKEGKVGNKRLGLLPRISSPVIWKETHHESLSWRVIEKRRSRQDGQRIFPRRLGRSTLLWLRGFLMLLGGVIAAEQI